MVRINRAEGATKISCLPCLSCYADKSHGRLSGRDNAKKSALCVKMESVPVSKRLFDIIFSLLGLILLSPLLLLTALLVRVFIGSPILFKQLRPGYRGVPFFIYKFRTMSDEKDANGELAPDARRLTHLGKMLRALSLDELPELFNILRGEMSFVGPRPLLMEYLPRYSPEQARRHEVVPGLTGWAQVNGRNALSWEEKFQHDVWYVDHWSFWLDIKIILKTFSKVFRREGIAQPGSVTAEVFLGGTAKETPKSARCSFCGQEGHAETDCPQAAKYKIFGERESD